MGDAATGVQNGDVDAAHSPDHVLQMIRYGCCVGRVYGGGDTGTAQGMNFMRERLKEFFSTAGYHKRISTLRELKGEGSAEAAGGAGNENAPVLYDARQHGKSMETIANPLKHQRCAITNTL